MCLYACAWTGIPRWMHANISLVPVVFFKAPCLRLHILLLFYSSWLTSDCMSTSMKCRLYYITIMLKSMGLWVQVDVVNFPCYLRVVCLSCLMGWEVLWGEVKSHFWVTFSWNILVLMNVRNCTALQWSPMRIYGPCRCMCEFLYISTVSVGCFFSTAGMEILF